MPIVDYHGNESYIGCCIHERERNMHHDSDFYMIVWDEEHQCAKQIEFATTRCECGKSWASKVDATPDVLVKYEAWRNIQLHREHVFKKWQQRAKNRRYAEVCNITYFQVLKLKKVLPSEVTDKLYNLLKVKKFRSKFRESLANQVRTWLDESNPDHPTPLSKKQMEYL